MTPRSGNRIERLSLSYILPTRQDHLPIDMDLAAYLAGLADHVDVVVVDGSPPDVFAAYERILDDRVRHMPPDQRTLNGKVGGVLTGLDAARHERVIVADDDVRYGREELRRMAELLEQWDVVRPQNYFDPLPWHACWDTGRTLLNRMSGGDWPGTLGVRRSRLQATGGYDGSVLFENLELVRTVRASGGRELVALDLFVRRMPATGRHFRSQRVRQAYDEFARPLRLALSLALLPLVLSLALRRSWAVLTCLPLLVMAVAEAGRRRGGGNRVFPPHTVLMAPLWLGERALCIWLALGYRLLRGGMPYRDSVLRRAATPLRELRKRHARCSSGMTRRAEALS